ncbi:MAG: hypothetical protein M1834_008289 [Cirrosporium novae-zelandiae]|nr:MAG: hypothetical protein M1834_008289 [Cirrosporium novae-zelandiae]
MPNQRGSTKDAAGQGEPVPSRAPVVNPPSSRPSVSSSALSRPPTLHNRFTPIKIHTAKCDRCNKHNTQIIYRCQDCGIQICTPCLDNAEDGGVHQVNMGHSDWTPDAAIAESKSKLKTAARGRGRGRSGCGVRGGRNNREDSDKNPAETNVSETMKAKGSPPSKHLRKSTRSIPKETMEAGPSKPRISIRVPVKNPASRTVGASQSPPYQLTFRPSPDTPSILETKYTSSANRPNEVNPPTASVESSAPGLDMLASAAADMETKVLAAATELAKQGIHIMPSDDESDSGSEKGNEGPGLTGARRDVSSGHRYETDLCEDYISSVLIAPSLEYSSENDSSRGEGSLFIPEDSPVDDDNNPHRPQKSRLRPACAQNRIITVVKRSEGKKTRPLSTMASQPQQDHTKPSLKGKERVTTFAEAAAAAAATTTSSHQTLIFSNLTKPRGDLEYSDSPLLSYTHHHSLPSLHESNTHNDPPPSHNISIPTPMPAFSVPPPIPPHSTTTTTTRHKRIHELLNPSSPETNEQHKRRRIQEEDPIPPPLAPTETNNLYQTQTQAQLNLHLAQQIQAHARSHQQTQAQLRNINRALLALADAFAGTVVVQGRRGDDDGGVGGDGLREDGDDDDGGGEEDVDIEMEVLRRIGAGVSGGEW